MKARTARDITRGIIDEKSNRLVLCQSKTDQYVSISFIIAFFCSNLIT